MFTAKCPNCGKSIVKQDFENKEKYVLPVRLLKFPVDGGQVSVKCRHCGHFLVAPFLRVVNE